MKRPGRRHLLGVFVVLAAGSAWSCAAIEPPRPVSQPPAAPRLRFLSQTPGQFDLWPSFSPDGAAILCCRSTDLRTFDLVRIAIDGARVRSMGNPCAPYQPTRPNWHWPTDRVALTGVGPDGEASLWVVDARTGSGRQIRAPSLGTACYYPCWSGDGQTLVVTDFDSSARGTIKRVAPASGHVESLTAPASVLAGRAWHSPVDGTVVFAGQENRGEPYDQLANRLFRRAPDGRVELLFADVGRAPSYSSDGRWIAFESPAGDERGRYAIMLMPARGGPIRRLTPYELNAQHPSWSPDGRSIVCFAELPSGERGYGLLLIDGVA